MAIKMLIGGSPCTHWSIAQTKNRETTAEGIGWELFRNYLIAKEKFQPDFFLYENNKSAAQPIKDQISKELGVDLMYINSALVSAQNRQRFYAFNWDVAQPEDRGILLRDILETAHPYRQTAGEKGYCLDASYWKTPGSPETFLEGGHARANRTMVAEPIHSVAWQEKSYCITATEYKGSNLPQTLEKHRRTMVAEPVGVGYRNRREEDGQLYRRFETHGEPKSNAMTTVQTDTMVAEPVNVTADGKAQCIRATCYKDGIRNLVGNTVDLRTCVAEPVFEYVDYTPRDKSHIVINNNSIRCAQDKNNASAAESFVQFTDVKCGTLTTAHVPKCIEPVRIGTIENDAANPDHDSKQYRVYSPDGKSTTLCGQGCGLGAKTGLYAAPIRIGEIGTGGQGNRIYSVDGKSVSQTATSGGIGSNTGLYAVPCAGRIVGRRINEQGHRADYDESIPHFQYFEVNEDAQKTNCITTVQKDNMVAVPTFPVQEATAKGYAEIQPGDCVDLTMPNSKTRRGRSMNEKCNCLTTDTQYYQYCGTVDKPIYEVKNGMITIKGKTYPIKLTDGYYIIRKLTPIECERLQTMPDNYTAAVSNTQRYKGLGNGWTAEIIIHILQGALKDVPKDEKIVVLSMYDGIGTGRYCLDKMGFTNVEYHAYEIDKYAIKVAMSNYHDIIQHGDAFSVRDDDWSIT